MQVKIVQDMLSLGYKADEGGVCFGFSMMVIQAIVQNQREVFERRLAFIQKEQDLPRIIAATQEKAQLAYKLKMLVKKIEAKKNITIKEINGINILSNNIVTKIRNKEILSQYNINQIKKQAKKHILTKYDQKVLETLSFFDGVELYFQPQFYQEWFNKKLIQQHKIKTSPFVESKLLHSLKGLSRVYSTSNLYTLDNLPSYFKQLASKLSEFKNVGIRLDIHDHSIALMYDSKHQKWVLFDLNRKIQFLRKGQIAVAIREAFCTGDEKNIIFATTLFSSERYAKEHNLIEEFSYLDEIEEHVIDEKKAHTVTQDRTNLLFFAAAHGYSEIVSRLLAKGATVEQENSSGITPLDVATESGHTEVVNELLKVKANSLN